MKDWLQEPLCQYKKKKSAKGSPYAIIKFSDKQGEFELFLFSEMLVNNREKLKESESYVLTLQKDISILDQSKKRINVKKILNLETVIKKPFSKVTIELQDKFNIDEIKKILSYDGETQVNLIIRENNKIAHYSLQNNRKFDLKDFKALKAKKYVSKITV